MNVGAKIRVHRGEDAHPKIRGRRGVVKGFGAKGELQVQLEGDHFLWSIDRSVVDVVEDGPPLQEKPPAPEKKTPE